MGGSHEQEKKETYEDYDSGEGEAGEDQPTKRGPELPPEWRAKSSNPNLSSGRRPKPANPASGAKDDPPARRGKPIRRIRRGGGGKGAATTSLTLHSNNVCGYNSKKASIPSIIEKLDPDICTWRETGLSGNNQIKIKGYHTSVRNRKNLKKMGGVATAVKNSLK